MSNNVEKNIQKNYLKDALRDLFYTVIIFATSYMPINILLTENLSIGNSILVITFAVFLIILGLFTLYSTLRNIYLIFNLNETTSYNQENSTGGLNETINEIKEDSIYEDKYIIISKNYIMDKKDYRQIIKFEDILGIYQEVHKTNNIIDRYGIVIVNKYGEYFHYCYPSNCEKLIPKLITIIASKSNNAKVGYNKETFDYIKNNTIKK